MSDIYHTPLGLFQKMIEPNTLDTSTTRNPDPVLTKAKNERLISEFQSNVAVDGKSEVDQWRESIKLSFNLHLNLKDKEEESKVKQTDQECVFESFSKSQVKKRRVYYELETPTVKKPTRTV